MKPDKYDIIAVEALSWFEGWLKDSINKKDKREIVSDIAKVFRLAL